MSADLLAMCWLDFEEDRSDLQLLHLTGLARVKDTGASTLQRHLLAFHLPFAVGPRQKTALTLVVRQPRSAGT